MGERFRERMRVEKSGCGERGREIQTDKEDLGRETSKSKLEKHKVTETGNQKI